MFTAARVPYPENDDDFHPRLDQQRDAASVPGHELEYEKGAPTRRCDDERDAHSGRAHRECGDICISVRAPYCRLTMSVLDRTNAILTTIETYGLTARLTTTNTWGYL